MHVILSFFIPCTCAIIFLTLKLILSSAIYAKLRNGTTKEQGLSFFGSWGGDGDHPFARYPHLLNSHLVHLKVTLDCLLFGRVFSKESLEGKAQAFQLIAAASSESLRPF